MGSKAFVAALIVAGVLGGSSGDESVRVSDAGARALDARIPKRLRTGGKRIITSKRRVSTVLILGLLMLTRPVLGKSRTACSAPSPTVLASTLTLTSANSGQSFSNYTISTTSGPCVKISGATNITLENFNIGPCGTNNSSADSTGVEIISGSGSNVFDSYIHVQNLSSDGGDNHEGILVKGASNVTIQGNVLAFNETNIEINSGPGGPTSTNDVIKGNFMLNPTGPFPRGQQLQTSDGTSNVTVENNRELSCEESGCVTHESGTGRVCLTCSESSLGGDAFPYYALQEDANNFYHSAGGTISGNWIEGGDSPSGQGILMDQGTTGQWTISNNIIVDSGVGCIGPFQGTGTISGNQCENLMDLNSDQNGIYVSDLGLGGTCGPWTLTNNTMSVLYGGNSGSGAGSSEACASSFDTQPACQFNSNGDDGTCGKTVYNSNNFDFGWYGPFNPLPDSGAAALIAIGNPVSVKNPPPPIPPLPKECVADSPYSQLSGATPTAKPTARLKATVTRTPTPTPTRTLTPWSTPTPEKWSWR